jgi:hypothetical protein
MFSKLFEDISNGASSAAIDAQKAFINNQIADIKRKWVSFCFY